MRYSITGFSRGRPELRCCRSLPPARASEPADTPAGDAENERQRGVDVGRNTTGGRDERDTKSTWASHRRASPARPSTPGPRMPRAASTPQTTTPRSSCQYQRPCRRRICGKSQSLIAAALVEVQGDLEEPECPGQLAYRKYSGRARGRSRRTNSTTPAGRCGRTRAGVDRPPERQFGDSSADSWAAVSRRKATGTNTYTNGAYRGRASWQLPEGRRPGGGGPSPSCIPTGPASAAFCRLRCGPPGLGTPSAGISWPRFELPRTRFEHEVVVVVPRSRVGR